MTSVLCFTAVHDVDRLSAMTADKGVANNQDGSVSDARQATGTGSGVQHA